MINQHNSEHGHSKDSRKIKDYKKKMDGTTRGSDIINITKIQNKRHDRKMKIEI